MAKEIEKTNMTNAEVAERLMHHIQRGGDTHPVVDGETAGFMSPEMNDSFNMLYKERKWVTEADVNTLAPGFYEGTNFNNGPLKQNVISEVDITEGRDGRRQIKYVNNGWSTAWEKTIHTNGGFTLGWAALPKEVTLWEGESNLQNEVTLLTDAHGGSAGTCYFRAIKIIFDYYGHSNSSENYANYYNNGIGFHAMNVADNSEGVNFCEPVLTFSNDGKRVKLHSFPEVHITKTGGFAPGNGKPEDRFVFRKIIGII